MGHTKEKSRKGSIQFDQNIKRITTDNCFYRRALYTASHSQLVVMSIPPKTETGEESQDDADKMLFIVKGKAVSSLNQRVREVGKNDVIFVPAGSLHNLKNVGRHYLKLFVIYSPPLYKDGMRETQEEASVATWKKFAYAWEQ